MQGMKLLHCQVPKAWTTLGHLRYLMNDYENAACCFERRISYGSEDTDLHYVYLRLGAALIYMSKVCYITAHIQTSCSCDITCMTLNNFSVPRVKTNLSNSL